MALKPQNESQGQFKNLPPKLGVQFQLNDVPRYVDSDGINCLWFLNETQLNISQEIIQEAEIFAPKWVPKFCQPLGCPLF